MFALLMALVGCADESSSRIEDVKALTGDATAGETVFSGNCASCHGSDATGGSGPSIAGWSEGPDEFYEYVLNGDGDMPAFDGVLADQDIADVYAYVSGL